ncbi:MAG: hypothetical protein U9N34_02285, partial [Candidatus Cloacimonadota bacterium]|nr:hypothetical protein [Candidatus Cloacimonadota bacterium]
LPLNYDNSTQEVVLTITKKDFIPIIDTLQIIEQALIDYTAIESIDGFIAGQDAQMDITIKNYGTQTATNITAEIITNDERITMVDSTNTCNEIAGNSEVQLTYSLDINDNFIDGEKVAFELVIIDGNETYNSIFEIDIESANIKLAGYESQDTPEPGEEFNFALNLHNNGSQNLVDATITILSQNTAEILSAPFEISIGSEQTEQSTDIAILFDENIVNGQKIHFTIIVETEEGFYQELPFSILVGNVSVTDPTGPDSYGYYIYDN